MQSIVLITRSEMSFRLHNNLHVQASQKLGRIALDEVEII